MNGLVTGKGKKKEKVYAERSARISDALKIDGILTSVWSVLSKIHKAWGQATG